MAGKSPLVRSCTVNIHGSGQSYVHTIHQDGKQPREMLERTPVACSCSTNTHRHKQAAHKLLVRKIYSNATGSHNIGNI